MQVHPERQKGCYRIVKDSNSENKSQLGGYVYDGDLSCKPPCIPTIYGDTSAPMAFSRRRLKGCRLLDDLFVALIEIPVDSLAKNDCLKGKHLEDPYKGAWNHLVYNCKLGHLPPLKEVEATLLPLRPW